MKEEGVQNTHTHTHMVLVQLMLTYKDVFMELTLYVSLTYADLLL